jgi:hypothetical protein
MAKKDFESAMAINLIANGEKLPLLVRAQELLQKHDETFVDSATLLTLAAEQLNFANNEIAIEYAERAIDLTANPILKAEAYRYAGRVMFSPARTKTHRLRVNTMKRDWIRLETSRHLLVIL